MALDAICTMCMRVYEPVLTSFALCQVASLEMEEEKKHFAEHHSI